MASPIEKMKIDDFFLKIVKNTVSKKCFQENHQEKYQKSTPQWVEPSSWHKWNMFTKNGENLMTGSTSLRNAKTDSCHKILEEVEGIRYFSSHIKSQY